jgi:succinate dehydrogenase flavin-adding protein (antitoxin of CptAB toxin-antitoxin module)
MSINILFRRAATSRVLARPMMQSVRFYKGEAGEEIKILSANEEALLKIAKPRADEIFKKHIEIPTDDLETRRKRLIYRSKQRGWLEVDLLLGTWASDFVPTLNEEDLDEFENFVNMETIDIYNVITLRLDVPESMKRDGNGVVERIQEWARSSPLGKADQEAYKALKTAKNLI